MGSGSPGPSQGRPGGLDPGRARAHSAAHARGAGGRRHGGGRAGAGQGRRARGAGDGGEPHWRLGGWEEEARGAAQRAQAVADGELRGGTCTMREGAG